MKNKILVFWNKISRIGLREDEGVLTFREVIFMNRLMFITPVVMTLYIPVEIIFNGFTMLPAVLIFIASLIFPMLSNYYRYFNFSKYYTFLVSNLFITIAGISVGQGTYNHMALIALVLFGVILFKKNYERILVLFIVSGFYVLQLYGYQHIDPVFDVPAEVRSQFSVIFFFMALLINFLLSYYFVGINTEYENIIEEQKNSLANKNKEITDSITYAKRIQNAILPSPQRFSELLPDSFVLYKPKDIVAGDFYWLEPVEQRDSSQTNRIVLFAAADCTGHGVPGAMVSVVCHNAINRSVKEFELTEPAQILNRTRQIIEQELNHGDEEIKDGMDISLCALNFSENTLQWSGANNPLLIIRGDQVIELKPDKQPVGRFAGSKPFTNHALNLEKGDMVYIFSDGYSDQFGGPDGKKYKYKNFLAILQKIKHEPCARQRELLEKELNAWKGQLEQLDDVCVIGVRI